MELLKGLDSLFIHHETPHAPLHVLAVMHVSRKNAPHPITADTYRALIAARIKDFPGLCKKLVDPPIKLAPPLWVRSRPDLRLHVQEKTLGQGLIPDSFDDFLAELDSVQLDRSRPLWEFYVVHESNSDTSYLIAKAHHALLDGMAGFELIANIFDADVHGADKDLENPSYTVEIDDETPDWATHIGATVLTQPVTLAQSSIKVARNMLNFAKATLEGESKPSTSLPWTAPNWPENRTLTPSRIISEVSLSKETIKQLRQKYSISFHDVLGTVLAGALRTVLQNRNELPNLPLVCVSPVSIRRKRTMDGNELSVIFAQLPTHLEDPIERIAFMRESFINAKDFLDSLGANTLSEVSHLAPWTALGALWNMYSNAGLSQKHSPFANVMLSSLPGPSFPLYCGGTQVERAFPYGPIFDGSMLNITAISYLDRVNCGIVSCPDSFDGVHELAKVMSNECKELLSII